MKNKRELWIQAASFPILLVGSSALSVSLGYGDFTFSRVVSTFVSAITFSRGYFEVLLLPVLLLLLYNFVVGVLWVGIKTIKYRRKQSIRKIATFPPTQLAAFCLIAYGLLSVGRIIEERKTEKIIKDLFYEDSTIPDSSYETRLSPPLDEAIFSNGITELRVGDDYSLIRLDDGSSLLAVVNENKKRIVITKN